MYADVIHWIYGIWIALGVIWAIGAVATKRTARAQTSGSRRVQFALTAAAYVLLLHPDLGIGPLGWRLWPESLHLLYTGLGITVCGAALAIWARVAIGRNWSANVTIKEDHQIIRGGPYAFVRHPMYSGLLLALLGTAVAIGQLRGLIALPLAFAGWWLKLRTEESLLAEQFGPEYLQYRQKTKALIPFVL